MRQLIVSCSALLISSIAYAQSEAPQGKFEVPLPPVLSDTADPEDSLEPEVTIRQDGRGRIEEHRINGRLYMIKITPSKGYPYYLLDSDGDGELETRRNDLDPDVLVPRWTLFEWD